ncbi:hypothetical protein ACFRIB_51975 [Streptomyces mirabilis]|uniref:hypothetical protein n=1 Tax=Streptomyces mirabilis TaxID=68239 RepID=UPI0036788003
MSEHEDVHIVHRANEPLAIPPDSVESLHLAPGTHAVVVVGTVVGDDEIEDLVTALEPVRGTLLRSGASLLHLVMAYGALDTETDPSAARRLCERWGVDVVAPSGAAVLVPGGTLFSPDGPSAQGGWWFFSPGHVPKRLGARYPTPPWERAVERLQDVVAEGHVAQQVPAGLLLQPAEAPAEDVDALRFAVPVDPAGPAVLVGVSGSSPVSSDAVASVLAALPGPVRRTTTLLPGDGRDVLATGQDVADALGIGIRVGTGLPVLLADDPAQSAPKRTLLVDTDGTPSWQPFVDVVTCFPAQDGIAPPPRLEVWRAPIPGMQESADPGVVLLDGNWQVVLTRAGMRVERRGVRTPPIEERPVDSQVMAVELGAPGAALDATAWPALERLFSHLPTDVRERVMIQVHGEHSAEDLKALRRIAVRHELALAPHGWRSTETAGALPPAPVAGTAAAGAPARPALGLMPAPVPLSPSAVVSSPIPQSLSPAAPAGLPEETPVLGIPSPAPALSPAAPESEPEAPVLGIPFPAPALSPAAPESELEPEAPAVREPVLYPPLPAGGPPRPLMTSSGPHASDPRYRSSTTDGDDGRTGRPETPAPAVEPEATPAAEPEATATAEETGVTFPATPDGTLHEVTRQPAPTPRRSTPAEHALLRTYLGSEWDRHVAAVQRALTHFPGLRSGNAEPEITADLAAVHAFVNADSPRRRADAVRAALSGGDPGLLAYLACLTSGLRRLPSYRGAAVRVAGVFDEGVRLLLPGEEVGEAVPVGAAPLDKGYAALPQDHYLIWSVTGRRTSVLTDSEGSQHQDGVHFGPGTRFRVLRSLPRAGATVMLLRELPLNAPVAVPGLLDDTDTQIMDRLAAVADQPFVPGDEPM